MKKLGLIAGRGDLPRAIAIEARSQGYHITAIALEPLADEDLSSYVDETNRINVGKLGQIIKALTTNGISEAVMAGKVPKSLLYEGKIRPDMRAVKLLFKLKNRNDDSILIAIAEELGKDGITLRNTTDFTERLMAREGIMTRKRPSKNEWNDILFGWHIAKEMGRLDIGQTVVIKNRAVMAIEAIEGTDEAIRRGGELAGEGAVVIKVSKPDQDMRFDVPAVGLDTVKAMSEVNASVLAVESMQCIILGKEGVLAEADKKKISVVGFSGSIS